MKPLVAGGRDLPHRINQAQKTGAIPASLSIVLHYLTAPFIQGFQHALLIQANPFPNNFLRESVKNCPRDFTWALN